MKIAAVILTRNEELHLERCFRSLADVADLVLVADCFSTDETVAIAIRLGASVVQKPWVNHANQFNWAIDQLPEDIDWVLRIDADEYLTPNLVDEIRDIKGKLASVNGVYIPRRMAFLGKPIRFGGVFPVHVLRLFRRGTGACENRWMDEHIKVSGETITLKGELVDDNLKSLTWWVEKHNGYASREVVDLLNLEYGFLPYDSIASFSLSSQASFKRWLKENVYTRLPAGVRAFAYFVYRYFFRLGFLDGRKGAAFHVLQGFWYRYLVDVKLLEVKDYMAKNGCDPSEAVFAVLGIDVFADIVSSRR